MGNVEQCLGAALERATRAVLMRLPSFEEDETGGGQLRRHGLRWRWTEWGCHPTAVRLEDVRRIADGWSIDARPWRVVRTSATADVEPIDGRVLPEQPIRFTPPLVACWLVRITQ
jgi:hypothetical protein